MTGTELASALLLGVLLPGLFSRPRFLDEHPMRQHVRLRWQFAYSTFAFAGIAYVYVCASYLLRPVQTLPVVSRNALSVGGMILLLVAIGHHVPPLVSARRSVKGAVMVVVVSMTAGFTAGGFLAIDALMPSATHPNLPYITWAMLLVLLVAAMLGFSGLSPESELALYKLKRLRRRRRVARSGGDTHS